MYTSEQLQQLVDKINRNDIAMKRRLILEYCDEVNLKFTATFYAKLLEVENDNICKWYEIRALGDLYAFEYLDLLLDELVKKNISFDKSSIHAITAYSIGKIGEIAIPKLSKLDLECEDTAVSVMDCFGEIKSADAIPFITKVLLEPYTKASIYAASALGKIGSAGINELKNIYNKCDYHTQFALFETLLKYSDVEDFEFAKSIISIKPEFWDALKKNKEKNYVLFQEFLYKNRE